MVKVVQAYNFPKQTTHSLGNEILAATLIDSNKVAVSSVGHFIEIYHIAAANQSTGTGAGNLPPKYSLPTVGDVADLVYCEAAKYLVTLENDGGFCRSQLPPQPNPGRNVNERKFVRIYTNFWEFPENTLIGYPITVRIASMTTPNAPIVDKIDVIELPLRNAPDLLQCCQKSGNIIVGSQDTIYFYKFEPRSHETTQPRFTYADFLPLKFSIKLNIIPKKICICENVIACMNASFIAVFKIVALLTQKRDVLEKNKNLFNKSDNVEDENSVEKSGEDITGTTSSESSTTTTTQTKDTIGAGGAENGLLLSTGGNSFETESDILTFSRTAFKNTRIDFKVARIANTAFGREFETELKSQWEQEESVSQEVFIYPTRANDIKIKLVNEETIYKDSSNCLNNNDNDCSVKYDIKILLQLCMKSSEPNSKPYEVLRCIDLRAVYHRSSSTSSFFFSPQTKSRIKNANKHRFSLKSNIYQYCVGFSLLVATSVDGYLYQFCAQGKWYNENEKPIAVYSFIAPVLKVFIDDFVIYAITTESLETHTSRIGHKLFTNRFEYPTVSSIFPEESSPDINAPVSVIGLCSFMNVQFVCANREQLILITNSAIGQQHSIKFYNNKKQQKLLSAKLLQSETRKQKQQQQHQQHQAEFTLYNLSIPSIEMIVEDIEHVAETFRVTSPHTFYDLMEEAHVMLRLSLSLNSMGNINTIRTQGLQEKFARNCRCLADFSIRSQKKEVYMQATGYYKMCNLPLSDIYSFYINEYIEREFHLSKNDFNLDKKVLVGLIYTVNVFLRSLSGDQANATCLNKPVKPFFTDKKCNSKREPQQKHEVPLVLELLNMFINCSPSSLAQIMLKSPIVIDLVNNEIISHLQSLNLLNPEESILLAVSACRISSIEYSRKIVNALSRKELAIALINNKNILFDDETVFFQRQKSKHETFDQIYNNFSKNSRNSFIGSTRQDYRCNNYQNNKKCMSSGLETEKTALKTAITTASFSDFVENVILSVEDDDLVEAISDAFIHALCIERSVPLDMLLTLFLNYIATHIGQKGYQTAQKVLVNILQVYFYDLYDINEIVENLSESNNELADGDVENDDYDTEDLDWNSINSTLFTSFELGSNKNIMYLEHGQHDKTLFNLSNADDDEISHFHKFNAKETNLKGLKILFRIYLGQLKVLSDAKITTTHDEDDKIPSKKLLILRLECIKFLNRFTGKTENSQRVFQQHQKKRSWINTAINNVNTTNNDMKYNHLNNPASTCGGDGNTNKVTYLPILPDYKNATSFSLKSYIRPIPCLQDRPSYLNRMAPFSRESFSHPKEEGEYEVHFLEWNNEVLTLALKIQALLASPKMDRSIIQELILFIQETPHLIGIDSFLVLILPKNLAINYMLSFSPKCLWQYGKSNEFKPIQWQMLFKKIMSKQEVLHNWSEYMTDILNNLSEELSLEDLLQCFPADVVTKRDIIEFLNISDKDQQIATKTSQTQDACGLDCSNWKLIGYDLDMKSKGPDMILSRPPFTMDNIDESCVFDITLRKAVSQRRSIALCSMIKSTGSQLFEATNNPLYKLN